MCNFPASNTYIVAVEEPLYQISHSSIADVIDACKAAMHLIKATLTFLIPNMPKWWPGWGTERPSRCFSPNWRFALVLSDQVESIVKWWSMLPTTYLGVWPFRWHLPFRDLPEIKPTQRHSRQSRSRIIVCKRLTYSGDSPDRECQTWQLQVARALSALPATLGICKQLARKIQLLQFAKIS